MVSTRLVPSASGFLGQASTDAQAGPPVTATKVNRKKNPTRRIRTHAYLYSRPSMASHALRNATSLGRKKRCRLVPNEHVQCFHGLFNRHLLLTVEGNQNCRSAFREPVGGNAMWLQVWTITIALAIGLAGIAMTLPDDA